MTCSISTYSQITSNSTLNGAEILVDFNAKEKDYESGCHYYGARYYDSEVLTGWLSVDPMADKYPSMSPYNYCAGNPVKLVDPDGQDARIKVFEKNGKKQLCIQTTVYLQSTEFKRRDLARLARNYTDAAKRKLKSMYVDGVLVSFDVSFKVQEGNTIKLPGDNSLKLNPNNKDDRSGVPCVETRENGVLIEETCGDEGIINADDIMGGSPAYAKSLNKRHYQNYINYINKHPELIDDNGNGVLKNKVDIDDFE